MKQPRHALLYTDDHSLGGVAQYNHSILGGLIAHGYQVTCVKTRTDDPLTRRQAEWGVRQRWLDYDTVQDFPRTLQDSSHATRILRESKPDVVLFSNCRPASNLAAKRVAYRMALPYVIIEGLVTPHLPERAPDTVRELGSHYARANAVIAVSGENLELLRQVYGLPKDRGQVIHYGRPAEFFAPPDLAVRQRLRSEQGIPADAVLCFTAAHLIQPKGYQYQLEAIRQLRSKPVWSQLCFAWAGRAGSVLPQVRETVREFGIEDRVKLLGQRWDVADWLSAADIFVLPSRSEGMPLSIMEAMARGLPVIASAVSGIPEELGETGKLLPSPVDDAAGTVRELAATIEAWAIDADRRMAVGQACRQRAEKMFREERMVAQTLDIVDGAMLPVGDYVSPGLGIIRADACFPHMILGDRQRQGWRYFRREVPHNHYIDHRAGGVGLLNRDEAHLLYHNALRFRGRRALEIGCFLGWSAWHLARAGVQLDVVDPLLSRQDVLESVRASLKAGDLLDGVRLVAGRSPQMVQELAAECQGGWDFVFIDGDHDGDAPRQDAAACAPLVGPDAMIIFHDLASPDVARGLDYLRDQGWNTLIYMTAQIMGVAWRGNVDPVAHQPDPRVDWKLPEHLRGYRVCHAS